jgi:hypothetical protein
MSSASVRISSTGAFRVIDGTGRELAASGTGEWRLVPAGNGVRITPPEDYQPALPTPAPAVAADLAVAVQPAAARRPARVVTASAPPPSPGLWGLVALTLVVGAGTAAIRLPPRRARSGASAERRTGRAAGGRG